MADLFMNQLDSITGAGIAPSNDLILVWDASASTNKKITVAEFMLSFSGLLLAALANGGWRGNTEAVGSGNQPITFLNEFPDSVGGNYVVMLTITKDGGNVPFDPIDTSTQTKTGFTIPNIAEGGTLRYLALPYA